MFETSQHKPIVTDLPIIRANYLELIADENPILYTGTNRYGNRILGSIIEESENFTVSYFHVIIDDKEYYSFINREITLRKVIETASVIFVVDFKIGEYFNNNLVLLEDIPDSYLPLEDSYCPEGFFTPSLNFGVSLKGKISDRHLVEIPEANNIQTSFGDVLKNALATLEEINLSPKLFLEPARTGSFRVNYRIEFNESESSLFSLDSKLIADYLQALLTYIISKLPQEENSVLKEENVTSVAFKEVETKLSEIYVSSHITISDEVLEQKLIENINESALKFEGVANQIKNSTSFNKIELLNYEATGGELGLGVIDETFFESIKEKLLIPEPAVITEVHEEDATPQSYRIRVYNFSSETGNCWAYFYPDATEWNYKLPIRIENNGKVYAPSAYSKSLDEEKVITIKGIATRINDIVKSISVEL